MPMKEVVRYRPSDPVEEVKSLQHQLARKPSKSPQRRSPALSAPSGKPQAGSSQDTHREVHLQPDDGQAVQGKGGKSGRYLPWKLWRTGQKGKGKIRGRRAGKGKGKW